MIWRVSAAVALLAAALLYARLDEPDSAPAVTAAPATLAPHAPAALPGPAATQPAPVLTSDWPNAEPAQASTPAPAADHFDNAAIASLRVNRDGDARAPTIGEPQPYQRADAHTLADPDRYQAWHNSRREANYADYLRASQARLVEIDAHLDWGRANGVSAAQLQAGQEKRDRLAAVREQLASDYPHLAEQVAKEMPKTEEDAAN